MTDQPTLSDRLAAGMTLVAQAEHHMSNQAAHVAELQRTGQDARRSLMILATLREAHDRFQKEVEDILKEMQRNIHP
jgi:hypothetical protein